MYAELVTFSLSIQRNAQSAFCLIQSTKTQKKIITQVNGEDNHMMKKALEYDWYRVPWKQPTKNSIGS